MPLVAGIDSSTQACTIVLRDADDGTIVGSAEAPHPPAHPPRSEQDPRAWWAALIEASGRLPRRDVAAINVDGQGHGLVALDAEAEVIRPAKLWNDTTSSAEASELVERIGAEAWAARTGIVPVSAITVSKLLWLRRHEPDAFARLRTVLLPPDYLTFRLSGRRATDRSEGSGTGYLDAHTGEWALDLLALVDPDTDWAPMLPDVLGPAEAAGQVTRAAAEALGMPADMLIGPGANDQPVCALALGITSDDVLVSLGTSGTVSVRHPRSVADPTGAVTGVADAAGRYRPLVCTINATRVTDFAARLLQVDYPTLSELALAAPSDADRPILVPFLEGERTPNRPFASGSLLGLRTATTRESMARAAFEGVLCSLLEGLDRLGALGVPTSGRVVLTGGGAASPAYRQLLADLIGRPVHVSDMEETSASGAAVAAAAVLHGVEVDRVVEAWAPALPEVASPRGGQSVDEVRDRYRRLAGMEALDG